MKKLAFLTVLCFVPLTQWAQTHAFTEYGDEVLLYEDGTWEFVPVWQTDVEPVVLPAPPFNGSVLSGDFPVKTKLVQEKATPNDITDTDAWFEENDLLLPVFAVPNAFTGQEGNLPPGVPATYQGLGIVNAISSADHLFLIYGEDFAQGRYLVITDGKGETVQHIYDFTHYEYSPEYVEEDAMFVQQRTNWAAMDGDILYVSHWHSTYAASSKGMNAYITAIDVQSNKVLWRTPPLVCNMANFEVLNDVIVCGYGFTTEKDYVYTINRKSGGIVQKLPVKTGPEMIVRKGNQLFVRTYDTDYVFGIR